MGKKVPPMVRPRGCLLKVLGGSVLVFGTLPFPLHLQMRNATIPMLEYISIDTSSSFGNVSEVNASLFFKADDARFVLPRIDPMMSNWTARKGHYAWLLDETTITSPMLKRPAPAQILLTNFGWNSESNMQYSRQIRGLEILEGIVNHPWFHPTAYQDIVSGNVLIDASLRYYIFLDVDTCGESNYPFYGEKERNRDTAQNRPVDNNTCVGLHSFIKDCEGVVKLRESGESVLITASESSHNIMLLFIQCAAGGPRRTGVYFPRSFPFAIASLSALERDLDPAIDQGMPPPAVNPIVLAREQELDIEACDESKRDIFLSFVGAVTRGPARPSLMKHLSGREAEGVLMIPRVQLQKMTNKTYREVMEQSVFALAPRGDSLFSYRFPEVLSAGAIPVVHADGWVWPFRSELVDWRKCAVKIVEKDAHLTLETLRAIDAETRCAMRKYCYELWQRYLKNATGSVSGLVEGMELLASRNGGVFPKQKH